MIPRDPEDLAALCRAAGVQAMAHSRAVTALHQGSVLLIVWPDSRPHWEWMVVHGGPLHVEHWEALTVPEDLGHALVALLGLPRPWAHRLAEMRRDPAHEALAARAWSGDPLAIVECARVLGGQP